MAYLHIVNPVLERMQRGEKPQRAPQHGSLDSKQILGNLIVAHGFDAESAAHWLREGLGNLIAFGPKIYRTSRFARAAAKRRTAERRRPNYTAVEARRDARIIPGWNRTAATTKNLCRSVLV